MRKLLSTPLIGRPLACCPLICCLIVLSTTGCSKDKRPDEYRGSILEELPFVYKMTVQQGNIITEDMVDQLEPGMTRRQVQFLLGTPLLTDFFQRDRWDYTYTIQRGHQPMEIRYLTLYFSDDNLTRIDGDMRPNAARSQERVPQDTLVSVPDYRDRKGLVTRTLEAIGMEPTD